MITLRKTISMLVATSMIALLAASLTGCGGGSGGSGTGSSGGGTAAAAAGYYVDPNTGSDSSGDGSPSNPYKTLAHAIQMASAVAAASSVNIYAASGAYNIPSSESFPVEPTSGENLIGQGAATISGGGGGTIAGGDFAGSSSYAVFFTSGVTSASVSNFTISGAPTPVGFDHATATLSNSTITGTGTRDIVMVMDGANATLTNNNIQNGAAGIQVADPTTTLVARGNNISQNIGVDAIYLGAFTAIPASAVDLGTASSPGNNTIKGNSTNGEGLHEYAVTPGGTIQASGNTWWPNIQLANYTGQIPVGSSAVAGASTYLAGQNYDAAAANIQF